MTPARSAAEKKPYWQAHQTGRDGQRRVVLDTAGSVLQTAGPDALTMRRIAGAHDR